LDELGLRRALRQPAAQRVESGLRRLSCMVWADAVESTAAVAVAEPEPEPEPVGAAGDAPAKRLLVGLSRESGCVAFVKERAQTTLAQNLPAEQAGLVVEARGFPVEAEALVVQ